MDNLTIKELPGEFSICKVKDFSGVNWDKPFVFAAGTDRERSVVCPKEQVPADVQKKETGWKGMRIEGTLEFSLVGILAPIADLLAKAEIGILVISTFETDYLFVKQEAFLKTRAVLEKHGYVFL